MILRSFSLAALAAVFVAACVAPGEEPGAEVDAGSSALAVAPAESVVIETTTSTVVVDEGSTVVIAVRLQTAPTANVTVSAASSDAGAVVVAPNTLTFTPANGTTFQSLVITGAHDPDAADETATITLAAAGAVTRAIAVMVDDDDLPTVGIDTSVATLALNEGASTTFGVRLTAMPPANTTVTIASSDTSAATSAPSALTFTSANWSVYQTVTVQAPQDADTSDEAVTVTATTTGAPARTVAVAVVDDDLATQGIITTQTSLVMFEGSSGVLGVRLAAPPATSLTVTLASTDPSVVVASPSSLTFQAADYDVMRTVTVIAAQDADVTDEMVMLTLSAPGVPSVAIATTVSDDDAQAIVGVPPSLTLREGQAATFAVSLAYQPAANLTVAITESSPALATSTSALIFTPTNWNVAQTVTVSAPHDTDAAHHYTQPVTLSSAGAAAVTTAVSVEDDDLLLVSPTSYGYVCPGDWTAISVRLAGPPFAGSQAVTIGELSGGGDVALTPTSLTFTAASWSAPQTVNIQGISSGTRVLRVSSVNQTPVNVSGVVRSWWSPACW